MIVSASYKTDIPAFYGRWFLNRLRAGFCRMVNAYNPAQTCRVDLGPDHVDGFVFWTKNVAPFVDALREVHQRGAPFVIQYTINGYPLDLESRVVDCARSTALFRDLAATYGPRALVWRYDPIVVSSLTEADFHRRNFQNLTRELAGATDEVVVSFMQPYAKTRRNLAKVARESAFRWHDPSREVKQELLTELAAMAAANRMTLTTCTQPELAIEGVTAARCIDAQRLMDVAGRYFPSRLKGNRVGCGCFASKDIGEYDTCPHGCVYCYAVHNRDLALDRYRRHDPDGQYLFTPPDAHDEKACLQLPLFDP